MNLSDSEVTFSGGLDNRLDRDPPGGSGDFVTPGILGVAREQDQGESLSVPGSLIKSIENASTTTDRLLSTISILEKMLNSRDQ